MIDANGILEALKITPETYEVYLSLPAGHHWDLQKVNNCFIVREKNAEPANWAWFEEKDFHEWFKFDINPPSKEGFTRVVALPEFKD